MISPWQSEIEPGMGSLDDAIGVPFSYSEHTFTRSATCEFDSPMDVALKSSALVEESKCDGAQIGALGFAIGDAVGSHFGIQVWGPFDLRDAAGHSMRPTNRKSCALLAILALSRGHRHSRKWLQSQLWSESAESKASGSLRQELAKLKRILGDALGADRIDIWLEPERFEFDHLATAIPPPGVELLQGMDIADEAFEDWLRDQRQYFANISDHAGSEHPPATRSPNLPVAASISNPLASNFRLRRALSQCTVVFDCGAKGDSGAQVAVQVFSELLWQKLSQYDLFTCIGLTGQGVDQSTIQQHANANSAIVRVFSASQEGEVYLGVQLECGDQSRRLFFRSVVLPGSLSQLYGSTDLGRLAEQLFESLLDALEFELLPSGSGAEAVILANEAKKLMFRLDKNSLDNADIMLSRAYESDPNGSYLAWRAYLRNTAFFQHRSSGIFADDISSDELALEALRQAPDHGIVQALSSQLEYVNQGNLMEPMIKAQRAVDIDRSDPLARALLSNALSVNGHRTEGYTVARQALQLSLGGPYEFYFHHFACMAATAAGNYETALRHARSSVSYMPEFVSPRRYEVVLAKELGDTVGVERAVKAMRWVEPDFEIASMLDPSYPVNTLRRLPLIEAIA